MSPEEALGVPYPEPKTVSQRMKNLSVVCGMLQHRTAQAGFASLSDEVERLEQERKVLLAAAKLALSRIRAGQVSIGEPYEQALDVAVRMAEAGGPT